MMTQKVFQAFVLTMTILAGAVSATAAPKTQKITIDSFPYVGSLGESAAYVEQELADKATTVCGSLDKVVRLEHVTLSMKNVSAYNVNPAGTPGGLYRDSIFSFGYPRVQGSADVLCKN